MERDLSKVKTHSRIAAFAGQPEYQFVYGAALYHADDKTRTLEERSHAALVWIYLAGQGGFEGPNGDLVNRIEDKLGPDDIGKVRSEAAELANLVSKIGGFSCGFNPPPLTKWE